ncbi:MAG: hypothetical protein HQM09_14710 [Candidatus Riflebacteria bacterium]|nr:hypothetical protein [Candidatus Riflebacteria bacterium]
MDNETQLLEIQRRIEEIKARRSEYRDITITIGSHNSQKKPEVGIWWLHEGEVFMHAVDAIACTDSIDPRCVEVEHIYVWPLLQQQYAIEYPELLSLKYNEISRGRVWHHRGFNIFSITCAPIVANSPTSIKLIAHAFGIGNRGYNIIIDPQYPL